MVKSPGGPSYEVRSNNSMSLLAPYAITMTRRNAVIVMRSMTYLSLRPGRGFGRGRLDCERPPPGRYPPSADLRQRLRPPPLRGGGDAKKSYKLCREEGAIFFLFAFLE